MPKLNDSLQFYKTPRADTLDLAPSIDFSKQTVAPARQQQSHIRSGLSRHDDNQDARIHQASGSSEDEAMPDQEPLFEIDYTATPLWQLLEDEQEEDSFSTASSFSSLSSSSSSVGSPFGQPLQRPKRVLKRASMSRLCSNRSVSAPLLQVSSVEGERHPLATESDEESDGEFEPKEQKTMAMFLSQVKARFKALSSVAASLSASNQSLIAGSDVFPFSPRATDEPIPVCRGRSMNLGPARPRRAPMKKPVLSIPKQPQQAPVAAQTKPKVIALKTYSVQEYALPMPRHRDIRENPDFLRIYALETLMRKNGKLKVDNGHGSSSSSSSSKAQVALMPRSDEVPEQRFPKYEPPVVEVMDVGTLGGVRQVPARWVGICINDI